MSRIGPGLPERGGRSGDPGTVTLANGPSAAQAALAAFEPTRLRSILDAAADGITVQDTGGRIIYANRAAARACGFDSPEEMLASSREEILARFELLDEDGSLLDPADLPGSTIIRGGDESSRVVGFRVLATAEERWAIVSATALRDPGGSLEFAINAFHDITARRRAEVERDRERSRLADILEERLADEARLAELIRSEQSRAAELDAIIGAIGEGIVVADSEGTITLANRTARDMLAPFEEGDVTALLARFEQIHDWKAHDDHPSLETQALTGGPGGDVEPPLGIRFGTSLGRLGGEPARWIEISAYPVGATSDQRDEAIFVLRDVTAAREREQAREAFIGMLSHELRTPVTTIYAGAKVLARAARLSEETRQGIFDDIHGEAERLHRLVEDVVAITRFGEGALEMGSEPVLLQRILPAVVRSEKGRWPGGAFELRLPADLPPVAGDATYVEQVVRNLLANAVKYSPAGSPVTIEASAAGRDVEVRVIDDGPGFPEADAERLFHLYYRSPSTAQKVSGSGIGLFVCSRLIDAMGGRMWATNREPRGAEFAFALRVVSEDR